jgi:hypothetical protein
MAALRRKANRGGSARTSRKGHDKTASTTGTTADEFRRFCQDHRRLRPIMDCFGSGHGFDDYRKQPGSYKQRPSPFKGLAVLPRTASPLPQAGFIFCSSRIVRSSGPVARMWREPNKANLAIWCERAPW